MYSILALSFIFLFISELKAANFFHRSRILGGQPSKDHQFPWQVAIESCTADENSCGKCGGALISPKFILTAAHCTDGKFKHKIGLGGDDWHETDTVVSTIDFIQHPKYDPVKLFNDIAILKLRRGVKLSKNIGIIQLADANIGDLAGSIATASGYGRTTGNLLRFFFWIKKFY